MTDIMDNTCTYTPLVSVIVPVYNAAQTLERCVEGILAQSFSDFELILVDDGSTDASGAICAAYSDADSRVVVVSQPNKGVSAARNAGLDRARGRYVAFCDSDDTVKDYWLSSMVVVAEKAGMIVCGYNILRPGSMSGHRRRSAIPRFLPMMMCFLRRSSASGFSSLSGINSSR